MSPVAVEPVSIAPPAMPSFKKHEGPAASAVEEINRLEAEMMRLRTEEEGRRAEVETARLSAENALRLEQERWRQQEEETARQRAQKEKQRIEVEAREQAEEEHHRQIAEHELGTLGRDRDKSAGDGAPFEVGQEMIGRKVLLSRIGYSARSSW